MTTERMRMNQPDTSPGPRQSVASVVGSPGMRGIFSRLTSRPAAAKGEANMNRTAVRLAWALWALTVLLVIGYIPLRYQWDAAASAKGVTLPPQDLAVLKDNLPEVIHDTFALAAFLLYSTLGALIVSRARERRIGWLFCAIGLVWASPKFFGVYAVYTLLAVPGALPAGLAAGWIQHWIWIVAWSLLIVFLPLLYPNGRLLSRRWKPVGWLAVGLTAGVTLLFAFVPRPLDNYFADFQTKIPNPLGIAALGPVAEVLVPIASLLLLLVTLASATSLLLRLRRASGDERAQLKWFAYIAALLVVLFVTYNPPFPSPLPMAAINIVFGLGAPIVAASLPLLTGLAILRYRLYAIDRLINRTLVYGALTASVVGLYVLLVGALGALFRSSDSPLIAILATGLVALLFHPLRQRVQRGVNRLLYGQRDEPYQVLARLGRQLEATLVPEAMLPTIVKTIAQALKLPYLAVSVKQGEEFKLAAAAGVPVETPLSLPLAYQGEVIGHVQLAPRHPGEPLTPPDRRLLDDLLPQIGMAVHAVRLTADVQRSRQHLVTAREEERRRLRRDLHDGIGPTLASLAQRLDTVARLVPRTPEAAITELGHLKGQVKTTIAEIRRLVYALRPPVLDELGLLSALREHLARLEQPEGLHLALEAPEALPELPAAVEVAVYRIVLEALTNVVRHAHAQACLVHLELDEAGNVRLSITDDGIGLPTDMQIGVGITSMRERAAELGGACQITARAPQGTRVDVRLPLAKE